MGQAPQAGALEHAIHLHTGWEVTPFGRISPPLDNQSAEFVALYALMRKRAPLVITSVEALMTRTMPRRSLEYLCTQPDLWRQRLDLEGVVSELAAYRLPTPATNRGARRFQRPRRYRRSLLAAL